MLDVLVGADLAGEGASGGDFNSASCTYVTVEEEDGIAAFKGSAASIGGRWVGLTASVAEEASPAAPAAPSTTPVMLVMSPVEEAVVAASDGLGGAFPSPPLMAAVVEGILAIAVGGGVCWHFVRTKDKTDSRQTERELEKNKRPSPLKDPSVIRSKERVYARITKPVFGFHRVYTRWNRLDELIMNMAGNKFYLRPKSKSKTLPDSSSNFGKRQSPLPNKCGASIL